MRPQTLTPDSPLIQVLARGVCPICALMRAFQNSIIGSPVKQPARGLCNFHAWCLAAASPAWEAVPIFRAILQNAEASSHSGTVAPDSCDWCDALRQYESARFSEFVREMQRDGFADWVRQFGTICLHHADRLIATAPETLAALVKEVVARNKDELRKQLAEFDGKLHRGEGDGGGILGHIAEFLVSQRGVMR